MSVHAIDNPRPRLWGLKTVLTAALVGPGIAGLVIIAEMLMFGVGLAPLQDAGVRGPAGGLSLFIMAGCYMILTPHILLFGLVGYGVYLLRHRVDAGKVWRDSQWALLLYAGAGLMMINGQDKGIVTAPRVAVAVGLMVATGVVWLLTHRWHGRPAPTAPGQAMLKAGHEP